MVPQPTFGTVSVPTRVVSASAAEENGEDGDDDDDDDDVHVGIVVVVEGGPAKASTTPMAETRTEAATAATATATATVSRLSDERILFLFFLVSEIFVGFAIVDLCRIHLLPALICGFRCIDKEQTQHAFGSLTRDVSE